MVVPSLYPLPPSTIATVVILPSTIVAVSSAILPSPITLIVGGDVYSEPELATNALTILPSETITLISASLPVCTLTFGDFRKLIISDTPYPEPPFLTNTVSSDPFTTGSAVAV